MRFGIIGFLLGVMSMALLFLIFQQIVIRTAGNDLEYRYRNYVFNDTEFPWSYLAQGRVITRFLFPVKITITYYDAQYNVVTQADHPGRYGAVVKITLTGGVVQYRFFTLYRTPKKVFWSDGPMSATAQLPPGTGIDPDVLRNQAQQIGDAVKNGFSGFNDESPNLAVVLAGLSETSPTDLPAVNRNNVMSRNYDWWFALLERLGLTESYPYLVDLPKDYDADPQKRWPLIFSLHGGAQRGTDLKAVRSSGIPGLISAGKEIPAIVIAPQIGPGGDWNRLVLYKFLDEMCAKYRIDPDRIYMTGMSMGGDAVWDIALQHPERFAALLAIAGESDPSDTARLKDIPAWGFVGLKDEVVPSSQTIGMINGIRQAGGHAHLTEYPDMGHNVWDKAYQNEAVIPWLLAQKRGQPEVVTPGVPTP